jgi:hypothetical protein
MNDLAPTALTAALDAIRPVLGDRLTTAIAVREQHGKDQTYHEVPRPMQWRSHARPRRSVRS